MITKIGVIVTCLIFTLAVNSSGRAESIGTATGPLDARQVREAEASFGNLVADAIRDSMNAPIALVTASQLRQTVIPAGAISEEALLKALLYPDEPVWLVTISGAQLLSALERGLSMLPRSNTGFLQISGMTVTYRSNNPEGQRLVEVRVGNAPVNPGASYRVAMPSSLARGALGYFRIFNTLEPEREGPSIGAVSLAYIRRVGTIAPQMGRLRDLARTQNNTS